MSLDPFYLFQPEETVRLDQQNQYQDDIGNDIAQRRRQISAGERFQKTDDDTADNGAADAVETSEDDDWEDLQSDCGEVVHITPLMMPSTMPLIPATRAAIAHDKAKTRFTFTPRERAARWLSATERM